MSEAQMRRISYLRSIVKDRDAEIERLRAALSNIRHKRREMDMGDLSADEAVWEVDAIARAARAAQPSPQETNMSDTAKPRFEPCPICDNTGWVCEGHGNHPWRGVSNRPDSCDFGPGIPCPSSTCEHSLDRRDDDDNAALRAEVKSKNEQFQQYARKMEAALNAQAADNERLREALEEAIEFVDQAEMALTPRGEAYVARWRAALDGQPAPGKEGV